MEDLWGRKGQDDRPAKPQASGGSVISTRSRAVEDRTAVEKEATSRMAPGHKGRPDDAACAQEPDEAPQKRRRGINPDTDGGQKRQSTGGDVSRVKEMRSAAGYGDLQWDGAAQSPPACTGAKGACSDVVLLEQPAAPCASDDVQIVEVDAATTQQPEQRGGQAGGSNRSDLPVQITAEIEELHQHVRQMRPLFPSAACPAEGVPAKAQVAACVAGCALPLSAVAAQMVGQRSASDSLRSMVLDVASRRSFAAKDAGADKVDALEDSNEAFLWQWELRDAKLLPKAQRHAAAQHKKHMHKVSARLTALAAAAKALADARKGGKAREARLDKALAKLDKAERPDLGAGLGGAGAPAAPAPAADVGEQQQELRDARAQPMDVDEVASTAEAREGEQEAGQASSPAAKAAARAEKQAEKEAARLQKEKAAQEREQARVQKEEEKEKQRLERERKRSEKETEKEQKRAEKEQGKAAKQAAKTGYKSVQALEKSRNLMSKFFKTPGKAQAEAGGSGSQPRYTPQSVKPQRLQALYQAQPYHELFTPAPEELRLPPPVDHSEEVACALQAARALPEEQLQAEGRALLAAWRARPRHRRIPGLPPTWARTARSEAEAVEQLGCLGGARLWRRKLIAWKERPDAENRRPPFYGSWSRTSSAVRPRRPFAKDPELTYDFEVDSEDEWEDEAEGENLSDADLEDDRDETDVEESDADGFVVPNGYVSEDEGVRSVQQELDQLCGDLDDDLDDVTMPCGEAAPSGRQQARMGALREALDKARRAQKPLIISRLHSTDAAASSQKSARTDCLYGDPALLAALQPIVLAPRVRIVMPPADEDAGQVAAAAEGNGGGDRAPPAGNKRGPRPAQIPDSALPDLIRFLGAHPEIKAVAKAEKEFMAEWTAANPARRITKKWVHATIKEIAKYHNSVSAWVVRPDALETAGKGATEEAGEKEERAGGQAEQQPQEARPQAVTPCEDAGGSGAQPVPPSILPDLIRFLDEHPEHDTTATAGREFLAEWTAANPGHKVTEEWVHDKIEESASYQDSVDAWVICHEAQTAAWAIEEAQERRERKQEAAQSQELMCLRDEGSSSDEADVLEGSEAGAAQEESESQSDAEAEVELPGVYFHGTSLDRPPGSQWARRSEVPITGTGDPFWDGLKRSLASRRPDAVQRVLSRLCRELSDATLAPSSVPASVVDALVDMLPNFPPGPAGVAVAGQGRSSPEDEAALELAILGALKQLVHSLMLPNAAGHPNVTPSTVDQRARAAPEAACATKLLMDEMLEGKLQRLLTGASLRDTPALTLAGAELLGAMVSAGDPGEGEDPSWSPAAAAVRRAVLTKAGWLKALTQLLDHADNMIHIASFDGKALAPEVTGTAAAVATALARAGEDAQAAWSAAEARFEGCEGSLLALLRALLELRLCAVDHKWAGGEQCREALVALVTPKAVGKLLLAKPLKEKRKTDELQRLKYLLSGVRRHCLNDLQRSQHDRAGDHLSSDKIKEVERRRELIDEGYFEAPGWHFGGSSEEDE